MKYCLRVPIEEGGSEEYLLITDRFRHLKYFARWELYWVDESDGYILRNWIEKYLLITFNFTHTVFLLVIQKKKKKCPHNLVKMISDCTVVRAILSTLEISSIYWLQEILGGLQISFSSPSAGLSRLPKKNIQKKDENTSKREGFSPVLIWNQDPRSMYILWEKDKIYVNISIFWKFCEVFCGKKMWIKISLLHHVKVMFRGNEIWKEGRKEGCKIDGIVIYKVYTII